MLHQKISIEDVCTRDAGQRAEVAIFCEVRQGVRPWQVTRLDDLSCTGFRIAWLPNCSVDQQLRIRIPGMQVLSARVCWSDGKSAGCEFAQPLYPAVFDHIVRQAIPANRAA